MKVDCSTTITSDAFCHWLIQIFSKSYASKSCSFAMKNIIVINLCAVLSDILFLFLFCNVFTLLKYRSTPAVCDAIVSISKIKTRKLGYELPKVVSIANQISAWLFFPSVKNVYCEETNWGSFYQTFCEEFLSSLFLKEFRNKISLRNSLTKFP